MDTSRQPFYTRGPRLVVTLTFPRERRTHEALPTYFATGIANSAPLPIDAGQRCMTLFCFV
jgi:hypothetical protein